MTRKQIGHGPIGAEYVGEFPKFYTRYFNPYVTGRAGLPAFGRMRGGKRKRIYPHKDLSHAVREAEVQLGRVSEAECDCETSGAPSAAYEGRRGCQANAEGQTGPTHTLPCRVEKLRSKPLCCNAGG